MIDVQSILEKVTSLDQRWTGLKSDILELVAAVTDNTVTTSAKLTAVAALSYFLIPTDLVADILPVGFADDAAVLAAAVLKLKNRTSP